MAYLSKDDYSLRIAVEHLDEIVAEGIEGSALTADQFIARAESWAKSTINAYLKTKYNMTAEFQKDSNSSDRDMQIVQTMIDLALCTMHKTINARNIPEHIAAGCEDAKTFLVEARDGLLMLDLPVNESTDTDIVYPTTFIGSQKKFISKPFQDLSLFDPEL